MSRSIVLLLLLTVLLQVGGATTYLRLSNYAQNLLLPGDILISTAGTYRMTLNSSGCQLRVEKFSGSIYSSVGVYTSVTAPTDCTYLVLNPPTGNVLNQLNQIYMPMNQACNQTSHNPRHKAKSRKSEALMNLECGALSPLFQTKYQKVPGKTRASSLP